MIYDKREQREMEVRQLLQDRDQDDWTDADDKERKRLNRAWAMRLDPTPAEIEMESILAESEWWWASQTPVDRWIVDYFCPALRLIIEVDGGYHRIPEQATFDQRRDRRLGRRGFTVLRFVNEELDNPWTVAAEIDAWCWHLQAGAA